VQIGTCKSRTMAALRRRNREKGACVAKEISYQNKYIVFKILSETYKEKFFQAYGLDLPNGSFALVDYESEDKPKNILKYLDYVARVMEKYYEEEKRYDLDSIFYKKCHVCRQKCIYGKKDSKWNP